MPLLTHGHRLGAYMIHGLLGEGGMAEVYRATHAALDRAVAIKVLNPSFNSDPTFPLRFRREAKVYATLNHPNIVHVYDFDETQEIAYLLMELATGGALSQRTGCRTTPRQALRSRTGTALLVLIVAKATVVRRVRCYRRHLDVLGAGVVIAFGLTVVSGVLPRLVGQVTGSG